MYDGDISLSVDLNPGDVTAAAERLQGEIEKIFDATAGKKVSSSFLSLKSSMDKTYKSANEIMIKMHDLEGTQIPTNEYSKLENELAKIDEKYTELSNKRREMEKEGKINTKGYNALEIQLEKLMERADAVREKMQSMEDAGTSHIAGEETEEYARLTSQLEDANNRMTLLVRRAYEFAGVKLPLSLFERLKSILGLLASAAKTAASKVLDLHKNLVKAGGKFALNGMKQTAKTILKLGTALTGANKLLDRFSGGLSKTKSSSDGFNFSLKKAIKFFVRYGLGVRSIFMLINKLRRALVEGFKNLVQYSDDFNVTVSNLLSSLTYLKNSFAAAFAPLVSVVAPILTQFIDKMSQAVNSVGQLFASLTGQNTFVQAKKVYQDYAKSLESNSKKANKKAKELKRTIAGFDDVEILKGPDKDTDTTDPSTDPKNMFTTKPVEQKFKDLADKLKDMWKNADFTELGRMLGQRLLDALNNIPWDKIKETLRRIARSIATFLNGFLETPGLFTAIGKTLAEALNSIFEFLNEFAKTFHWDSLGQAVKDAILGFLNNIDWPLIYDTAKNWGYGIGTAIETAFDNEEIWTAIFTTIANFITALLYRLDMFIKAIDWASLATNIGMGLNNAIENFNWSLLALTLIDLINAVFNFWYNFVTTFDFKKFGEHIGTALSTVLRNVDWAKGGAAVGATILALFKALNGFIEKTDWGALGRAIVDVVGGFFGAQNWKTYGKYLSNCITALFTTLASIISSINWAELPGKIIKAIKDYFSGVDWKAIADATGKLIGAAFTALIAIGGWLWNQLKSFGKNLIEGGFQGIIDKLANIGSWIKEHILKPFIDGFKSAFKIHSPSKVMEEMGGYVLDGLTSGIKSKIKDITDKVGEIKDKIKGIFDKENWSKTGSSVISKLKEGLSDNTMLSNIVSAASSIVSKIQNKFKETRWSDLGSNIASGISEGVKGSIKNLETTAWNLAVGMYNKACEALGISSPSRVFRDKVGKMIPAGLAEGVDDSANTAFKAVSSLSDALVNQAATDIKIPAVVSGEVVPYSLGKNNVNDANNTLNKLLEMLQYNQDMSLTRDDLRDVFEDLLSRYLNIDFYIGDEQIARHAKTGSERLNRRYRTTRATT